MDTTSAGLTAFVDSLFTQKSYQKLIKSWKNSTIKTSTSDSTLHSYELLIALMPSNTTFEIQLSDENLSGPHILSRLEAFAAWKITVITLSHDKAIELFLAPSEVSRLATLLYTGSWAENLRVLQVYWEEESSSIKLLRAVTQLYNLKELELKWKNGGEKKAKGILKRRNEIFGKFQILDVWKINDDF